MFKADVGPKVEKRPTVIVTSDADRAQSISSVAARN